MPTNSTRKAVYRRLDAMENAETVFVVKFPASHFDTNFRDAASGLSTEVPARYWPFRTT